MGSAVVAGGEEKRCKGLLLLGLAEEILMSWIWWFFCKCSFSRCSLPQKNTWAYSTRGDQNSCLECIRRALWTLQN